MPSFNIETFDRIKRIAIVALASDDHLVESLVLKGGNAIALFYEDRDHKISRASYDLDFSLDEKAADLAELNSRIEATLKQTFKEHGYDLHDYRFQQRPKNLAVELEDCWGGYLVRFKLRSGKREFQMNPDRSTIFNIDISRHEFTAAKECKEIDEYRLYVYSPAMIVFEKLRALCQQLEEYGPIIGKNSFTPRARDYYDIVTILETTDIDVRSEENLEILKAIFAAKKVPLDFMAKLPERLYFHRENWLSVIDTASMRDAKDLDYYAARVHALFEGITFPPDSKVATD